MADITRYTVLPPGAVLRKVADDGNCMAESFRQALSHVRRSIPPTQDLVNAALVDLRGISLQQWHKDLGTANHMPQSDDALQQVWDNVRNNAPGWWRTCPFMESLLSVLARQADIVVIVLLVRRPSCGTHAHTHSSSSPSHYSSPRTSLYPFLSHSPSSSFPSTSPLLLPLTLLPPVPSTSPSLAGSRA